MDELVEEFLSEASENLLTLDNELIELENNPENHELLSSIFRVMHTIKGTCGFLGLDKLASVAHAGENIMSQIRSNQLQANKANISVVLEAIDTIKLIIKHIRDHDGEEPKSDYSELIKKINQIANLTETAPVPAHTETKATTPTDSHDNLTHNEEAKTIRVGVAVLEKLMQLVSELVLNRNQLIQIDRNVRDNRFSTPLQRLNVITSVLQETVMETRMQPINNAWIQIPRIVRDLATDLNKKIKLVMIGKNTELDRQLIESIKDPLLHMIRNSADHGLESTAERIAEGKPEEGTITLKAYHQSGHIIIEVSDDGRGINLQKVRKKILQNALATEADLEELTDQQIMQYIFREGFSTAEVITSLSGRGVGMDVVKNNIEHIRGTVELKSVTGKGSTFIIKIPLTLAIMSIVVVEVMKQKFGIPQVNVIEMVRTGIDSEYIMDEINGNKILRLRDSLLPLIELSDILYPESKIANPPLKEVEFIVVCEISGNNFGLIVDKIHDTEEIVLKPVSKLLKSIDIYSGNTLLGNGDVIMILDISGVIKYLAELNNTHTEFSILDHKRKGTTNILSSFLIIRSNRTHKAIPLELVTRLEEIDVSKIEFSDDKKVIQYNDSLMYLITLDPSYKIPETGIQQVVVLIDNDHILGIAVEEILDIIEQDIENNLVFEDSNLTSLVLGGKTMDVINVGDIFNKIFFTKTTTAKLMGLKGNILFIDDSPYFRKLIPALIENEGFRVSSAKTATEALEIFKLEKQHFDLIITDINMLDIEISKFAQLYRDDSKLKSIPIIALTSNIESNNDDNLKAKSANVKLFVSKTNQEELITLIHSLLDYPLSHVIPDESVEGAGDRGSHEEKNS